LLVACFIMGDVLASRMALASKGETMSNLMPLLKDCLTLLRTRLPCLRITRVTFYTLPVIPRTKLGEFTLGSLTLARAVPDFSGALCEIRYRGPSIHIYIYNYYILSNI
jgi:hypothetical protein